MTKIAPSKPLRISVDVDTLAASIASGTFKAWYAPASATISQNGKSLGLKSSTLLTAEAASEFPGIFPQDARWSIVTGSSPDPIMFDSDARPAFVSALDGGVSVSVTGGGTAIGKPGGTIYTVDGDTKGHVLGANIPSLSRGDTLEVILPDGLSQKQFDDAVQAYTAIYAPIGVNLRFGAYEVTPNKGSTLFKGSANDDFFTLSDALPGAIWTLDGGDGNDNMAGENCSILGGRGDDYIMGGNCTIDGGAGADTITVTAGDVIVNDDAKDVIIVGTVADRFSYLTKAKIIYQLSDKDEDYDRRKKVMLGGRNDDQLTVYTSGNTLTGGGGHDTFLINAGGNVITDLTADDVVFVGYDASKAEIASWAATGATVEYILDGIKGAFEGLNWDDDLTGDDSANTLSGLGGHDFLNGAGGNDSLAGGDGNDTLKGGTGNDALSGGDGDDFIIGGSDAVDPAEKRDDDVVDCGAGNDTAYGGCGDDTLRGQTGDDLLDGGIGDDKIFGGIGADTLWGGAGADSLWGETGNDVLYGGEGADLLYGGAGNDTISFSTGGDSVYGEAGHDVFVFTASNEAGLSQILDFNATEDKLDLSSLSLVDGFSWDAKHPFADFAYDAKTGLFQIDLNHDGTVDLAFCLHVVGGAFDMRKNVIVNKLV
ncbi:MAG: calcium-binding protein [Alsobacter sp.]